MKLSSELINEFATGLLKPKSFEALMFGIARQVRQILELDETILYSVQGELELRVAAIGSRNVEENSNLPVDSTPFGRSPAGAAAKSGLSQVINCTELEFPGSSERILGSRASVPIKFDDNLIAVLDCDRHQGVGFSEQDLVSIETLTNIAAPRIAGARLQHNELQLQSQKVESLSIFVGGIAHDFNNNLQALQSSLTAAKSIASENVLQFLDISVQACEKSQGLIRQLMAFTKGNATQMEVTELETLVRDTANLALTTRDSNYEFEVQEKLKPVTIDRSQIEQVVSNLLINADQSYRSGGKINIRLFNAFMPDDSSRTAVQIQIEDFGGGIPDEKLELIFQPYFSTKPTGSGLGLATSYFIVQRHHGEIRVTSAIGKGTTFDVFLPTTLEDLAKSFSAPSDQDTSSGSIDTIKVMVVDDEQMVQQGIAAYLRSLGYLPTLASSGKEAIYTFNDAFNSEHPIGVVIIDLNLPDGDGAAVLQRLRQVDPNIPAIVTSGIGHSTVLGSPAEYGFAGVLPKPFNLKKLEEELNRAMSSRSTP